MYLDNLNQTIILKDGRILGYSEAGDLTGTPLFLFHGLNSSRLEVIIAHKQMLKAGIRCIGVDRPGMGLSTFHKHRSVLDFVNDIIFLADNLGLDKFSVMGISAGTPYALACIYKIPNRIISCGIISGVAPVLTLGVEEMSKESRSFILLSQKLPWLVKYIFWFLQGRFSQNLEKEDTFLENIMFSLDDVDKQLIKTLSAKNALVKTFRESYKQGSKGVAYDGILTFAKPWGFKLEEIDFRPINLWHGEKDNGVPVSLAKSMSEKLLYSILKTYTNEGHLSIIFNQLDDIINDFSETRDVKK